MYNLKNRSRKNFPVSYFWWCPEIANHAPCNLWKTQKVSLAPDHKKVAHFYALRAAIAAWSYYLSMLVAKQSKWAVDHNNGHLKPLKHLWWLVALLLKCGSWPLHVPRTTVFFPFTTTNISRDFSTVGFQMEWSETWVVYYFNIAQM